MFCPVCRYKDKSCKVRFLGDQPFYSCQSCFDQEERRQKARGPTRVDLADPLEAMGYRSREPSGSA